jgi:transglutaminase-like putative cysteine protease
VAGHEQEIWLPLVDEPVGNAVARIRREDPEIERLVGSPHRILAFRTFAYIRVGLLLGELLFEQDLTLDEADKSWVEALLRDPKHYEALHREVRAVAEEIAADPKYADEGPLGPDEAARERFREFAKQQLSSGSGP